MTQSEFRMEENIKNWNMAAIVLFAILAYAGFAYLLDSGMLLMGISLGDFIILSLAILRLVRLLAYDNITLFIREAFMDVNRVKYAEGGEEFVERVPSENSFKRTISKLLNCPWCTGVWVALVVLFLYQAFPMLWILFLLLALSSFASLLHLLSIMMGWNAELKKVQATQLGKE
ncbi:MAG: hypothetical protein A2808_03375 [Candidatus Moranbacteria bacterium RIFCSPHIGHO2_01_FULL_55_24]|nr:MAG: hypothetical protein A2808_03375 [Candidatus Moranbacteria bacterium RIFCSPHIGHO2_01_FULL_55_24]